MSKRVLLLMGLLLCSCAPSGMSGQELADHGEIGAPPHDPQASVRAYFEHALKDPYSAHYEFGECRPRKAWGGAVRGGWVYGYLVVVNVNARNGFGGYTGYEPWQFILRGDEVYFVIPGHSYHGLLM